jgi:hypothetical protein
MANYVPSHKKKRERLEIREEKFLQMLKSETDLSRIVEEAEIIRAAKIRALKAVRRTLPPSEKYAEVFAKLDKEMRVWAVIAVGEIIEGYRTGKLKGVRAQAVRRNGGEPGIDFSRVRSENSANGTS